MTTWGTITIGRMTLRETTSVDASYNGSTGRRVISLSGQESCPPLTLAQLRQRQEDVLGLADKFVQVTFSDKPDHDGYYLVTDVDTTQVNQQGETATVDWSISAERIGPANAVDIESRLTGAVRVNDFALTGERWHAPSGSATGYYTGTTRPSGSVVRVSSDGPITVYRGVPAGVNPRWSASTSNYPRGRARVLVDGTERVAEDVTIGSSATWEINNGLVSASAGSSATLRISAYDGTQWEGVDWNVSITASASSPITSWDAVSILRNDMELVTVRLMKASSPGRALLDLTLRRGARFVEGFLQVDTSSTTGVYRATTEAGNAGTNYVRANVNDAAGNRYVVGTARSFSSNTTGGGLSKAATTTLDFFVGAEVGGSAAQSGDGASTLRDQYLVAMAETTMGVRR